MTRLYRVTIIIMAHTPWARRSAVMAELIRSEWRRARNGLAVATWIAAPARRRVTSNAWNSFSRHIRSVGQRRRAIRAWRRIYRQTRGVAHPRKGVPPIHFRPRSKRNAPPEL